MLIAIKHGGTRRTLPSRRGYRAKLNSSPAHARNVDKKIDVRWSQVIGLWNEMITRKIHPTRKSARFGLLGAVMALLGRTARSTECLAGDPVGFEPISAQIPC